MHLIRLLFVAVLALGALSCGAGEDCARLSTCAACLDVSGCNWTGGFCSDDCVQDASCFGPGNPAAPSCPD